MKRILLTVSLLFSCSLLIAEIERKTVTYSIGETTFVSTVVWDAESEDPRPGLLMVPNWMGPTGASLEKAEMIADDEYVVMMVDMYGQDIRPADSDEAARAADTVRQDRNMMRERALTALRQFRKLEGVPLEADQVSAIGFCFGGGTVLEMGRAGARVDAIVSFHGDLLSPTLESTAGMSRAKVLVLHGAEDPFVPQEHVEEFIDAMLQTEVDWQLIQYANTVHSFTDPDANWTGKAEYHPLSAERAFEAMEELFEEIYEEEDDEEVALEEKAA